MRLPFGVRRFLHVEERSLRIHAAPTDFLDEVGPIEREGFRNVASN